MQDQEAREQSAQPGTQAGARARGAAGAERGGSARGAAHLSARGVYEAQGAALAARAGRRAPISAGTGRGDVEHQDG